METYGHMFPDSKNLGREPILRHSKIAVTMEIYTEVPSAATRDALRKLGEWLGN